MVKLKPAIGSYHEGERQRCIECNGLHWYIGRSYAECANEDCRFALPLSAVLQQPAQPRFVSKKGGFK